MRSFISILVNRLLSFACFLLKGIFKKDGSVTPGYYATKFNPDILDELIYPTYIIGVTGSSGKGSTTSLIAHVLEGNGYKVVWNKNGSNLYNAAATLILNNTNPFTKRIKADVLLLELDESFIKRIFNKVKLTHLVVTNITRDQPARNGHPDIIFNKIASSIDANTHLVINADDPIVARLKTTHKGKITTYGIAKYKTDVKEPISNTIDAAYCPVCDTKLKYNFYHYGHLGDFTCPKCKFSRNKLDYQGRDIDLDKQFMTINRNIVHLNKNVFFCAYYTLATFALLKTIGLETKEIQKYLNDEVLTSKRMKEYKLKNRPIEMIESKNENALSYLQTINYIKNETGKKTIILGFDNVSRRYEYNDISWLYDVDFELLNDDSINKIFCIGRFRYDVYNRLKYAGIRDEKLVLVDEVKDTLKLVEKKSKGKIYTMVCFDMTAILKKLLEAEEDKQKKEGIKMKIIKIAHLYYDLMNLYGESGNILALTTAIKRQGGRSSVTCVSKGDKIDFSSFDIFYIGAGTEKNQMLVLKDLLRYKTEIKKIINKKVFIATGNSYELFGKKINNVEALGVFNFESKTIRNRIVKEQVYKTYILDKPVIGFQNRGSVNNNQENHLFEVIEGNADNNKSKFEGIHINNFYGTYTIGPLLIRNPHLLDKIIKDFFNSNKYPYKEIKDTPDYKAYDKYLENFNINK